MPNRLTRTHADAWTQSARFRVRIHGAVFAFLLALFIGLTVYALQNPTGVQAGSDIDADFPGVARIETSGGAGSGFLVDTRYLLTAAHVVGAVGTDVRVSFKNGSSVDGSVVASGYDELQNFVTSNQGVRDGTTPYDWALVELASEQPFDWTLPTVTSSANVPQQSDVLAVGFPGGGEHNISGGILSGRDATELRTDANIDPGHSGGLLYSVDEQAAIGIIVSTPNIGGERARSVHNAIPIELAIQNCRDAGYLQAL